MFEHIPSGQVLEMGSLQGLTETAEMVVGSWLLNACDTSYIVSLLTTYRTSKGSLVSKKDSIELYVACQALVAAVKGGSNVDWLAGVFDLPCSKRGFLGSMQIACHKLSTISKLLPNISVSLALSMS
jgi:hypothetical protein